MKSSRGKKEIIFPIFLECKEQIDNPFWKSLFEDFAYGKYPKQLYITNYQQIQSSSRVNFFQYCFKNKTPAEMVVDIQELLLQHTNIISNEEVVKKKSELVHFKTNTWKQWKDIKKKFIRTILIMDYCIELKEKYKFSQTLCIQLYHKIMNMVINGEIQDIELRQNKIYHIPGLTITEESFELPIQYESKSENLYEYHDFITNYTKRYLIRFSKLVKEYKSETEELPELEEKNEIEI